MDELFSCRNCVNNCAQTINVGRGDGFCLQHNSVLQSPSEMTCKYLHRKDLPSFTVNEGVAEHAAEFANLPGIAWLATRKPVDKVYYSERYAWEKRAFNPLVHAVAQYHKSNPAWVFIQSFSGGMDGSRSLTHACLIRRYMNHCGTWTSSYRLILGSLQEIDQKPHFARDSLIVNGGDAVEVERDALWDVLFTRISAVQEYGWHAGIETIMWATDDLNGGLSELNWDLLSDELSKKKTEWTDLILEHAKAQGEFFPPQGVGTDGEEFR